MTVSNSHRDIILKITQHLESAHDGMNSIPESYKRDQAYELIEKAHQAVANLLLKR